MSHGVILAALVDVAIGPGTRVTARHDFRG